MSEHPKPARKGRAQKEPPLRAKVVVKAGQQSSSLDDVDPAILERVRKMWARAEQADPNGTERQTAFELAARYMKTHNITQSQVIASATTAEEKAQLGGETSVRVQRTDPTKAGRLNVQGWFGSVSGAMTLLFDCMCFKTSYKTRGYIEYTFYGITSNAAVAAEGFEVAMNAALHGSMQHKGNTADYLLGFGRGLYANAKIKRADEEKEAERIEQERNAQEELEVKRKLLESVGAEQQRRLEALRLQGLPVPPVETEPNTPASPKKRKVEIEDVEDESNVKVKEETMSSVDEDWNTGGAYDAEVSSDDDGGDNDGWGSMDTDGLLSDTQTGPGVRDDENIIDGDDVEKVKKELDQDYENLINSQRQTFAAGKPADSSADGSDNMALSNWTSTGQLTLWRKGASDVAKEYIKTKFGEKGLKKSRRSTAKVHNYDTYKKGKKDGTDHDVKRQKLAGAEGDCGTKGWGPKLLNE